MSEAQKALPKKIAQSAKDHLSNLIIPSIEIDEKPPGIKVGSSKFVSVSDFDNDVTDEKIMTRLKISFNISDEVVKFKKTKPTRNLGIEIATKIEEITTLEDNFKALIDAELEYLKLVSLEELILFPPSERTALGFPIKKIIIDILDCELLQILFNMSKIIKHIDDKNNVEPDFSTKIKELKREQSTKIKELKREQSTLSDATFTPPVNKLILSIDTITGQLPNLSEMLDEHLQNSFLKGHEYKIINILYNYFKLCYQTILTIRKRFHSSNNASLTILKAAISHELPSNDKRVLASENNVAAEHPNLVSKIKEFLLPEADPSILNKYFYYPLANVYTLIQSDGLDTRETVLQKEKGKKIDELNTELNKIKFDKLKTDKDSKISQIKILFSEIETYKNEAYKKTYAKPLLKLPSIVGGARKRTKRKKQKNNKVSQRKNKIKIKVKKHASRKARAKGKTRKGRKL